MILALERLGHLDLNTTFWVSANATCSVLRDSVILRRIAFVQGRRFHLFSPLTSLDYSRIDARKRLPVVGHRAPHAKFSTKVLPDQNLHHRGHHASVGPEETCTGDHGLQFCRLRRRLSFA
jgi:hypothetical protein